MAPMNMHKQLGKKHQGWPQLPPSFAETSRRLGLQGWEQGHSDLVVSRHGLVELLKAMLANIVVDEPWYLETYPDVRRAVDEGSIADAETHSRTFGYFEGRLPAALGFDPDRYLEKNPDLKQPLGARGSDAIFEHFLRHGYQEGRDY